MIEIRSALTGTEIENYIIFLCVQGTGEEQCANLVQPVQVCTTIHISVLIVPTVLQGMNIEQ